MTSFDNFMYYIRGKMGKLNITIVYYSTKVYLREAFPRQESNRVVFCMVCNRYGKVVNYVQPNSHEF